MLFIDPKRENSVRGIRHAEIRDIDRLVGSPRKLFQGIAILSEHGQPMSCVGSVFDIVVHSMSEQLNIVLQLYRAGDNVVYVTTDLGNSKWWMSDRKAKKRMS